MLQSVTLGLPLEKPHMHALLYALILSPQSCVASLVFNCGRSSTLEDFAAVCSALPYAHKLHQVTFKDFALVDSAVKNEALSCIRYAWTNARTVDGRGSLRRYFVDSPLVLVDCGDLDTEYPLREATVQASNRLKTFSPPSVWFSSGDTVTMYEPAVVFESPSTDTKIPRHSISPFAKLNVVASQPNWFALVVPCRGLCWVPCHTVTLDEITESRTVKRLRTTQRERLAPDFALSISCKQARHVASLLELFNGALLTVLHLVCDLDDDPMRCYFAEILKACPRLRVLKLHGGVEDTQALVRAYRSGKCHIESLSF